MMAMRGWMRCGIAPTGLILVACAGGGDTTPTLTSATAPAPSTASASASEGTTNDSTTWVGGSTEGDDEQGSTTTGDIDPPTDASSTTDIDDTSGDDRGSSSGSPDDACPLEMTCLQGATVGGVSGDESSPGLEESGTTPLWLEFQVSEDNDGVLGESLSARVRLVSDGGDFDLYAYLGNTGARSGCGGVEQSSTSSGSTDTVSFSWGETGVANNNDDGAFIAVEIVAKDDVCQPGASWTLTIDGDT